MVFFPRNSRTNISRVVWRILVCNYFFISWYRLALVLMLSISCGHAIGGTLSETDKSVRSIVSGIVSYTRWPTLSGPPTLCVFASSRYVEALSGEGPTALPYTPVVIHNDQEALSAGCNALYFGSESPTTQLELSKAFNSRPLLLIAEQNPQCLTGSAFCLIIDNARVRFSVNLDVLSRSGVRVNPDVLMLARNKKHE